MLDTVYGGGSVADNAHAFKELALAGLEAWKPEQLFFFGLTTETISHYIELDDDLIQKKVDSQLLHCSQYKNERQPLLENMQWQASQVAKAIAAGADGTAAAVDAAPKYAEGYIGFF